MHYAYLQPLGALVLEPNGGPHRGNEELAAWRFLRGPRDEPRLLKRLRNCLYSTVTFSKYPRTIICLPKHEYMSVDKIKFGSNLSMPF